MKIVFYTRFNRIPDDGWRVKKTIANPDWWEKRIGIMKNTLVPSLRQQIKPNFIQIAVFTDQIEDKFYLDAQEKIRKLGFQTAIDKAPNETLEYIPYKNLVNYGFDEDIVLVGIDSDDMVSMWLMQKIEEYDKYEEGTVFAYGNGYLVEYQTNRVFNFLAHGGHLPFVTYYLTKESLKSEQALLDYLNKWGMNVNHYNIHKAPKAVPFPMQWLMSTNENNTSTKIGNPNVDKRLGSEVMNQKIKDIIFKTVGYNANHD